MTIPVDGPNSTKAFETKYTLLSYKKSYRDNCGDTEDSEIRFEENMTFEAVEEAVNNMQHEQPDGADYDEDGAWQFLVFADGVPVGGRGIDFEDKRRWPKGTAPKLWEAIAESVEDMFERVAVTSHAARMKRYEEAARQREIEQKKAKEQREAWAYSNALDTLATALNNRKLNPEIAFKEKKILEKLTAAFTTEEKKTT